MAKFYLTWFVAVVYSFFGCSESPPPCHTQGRDCKITLKSTQPEWAILKMASGLL